jgi:hypothetical protein
LQAQRFGFVARHIRAYRQDARAHPARLDEQRSECYIPGTNQIGMEDIMATLTHEEQAMLRAICLVGMSGSAFGGGDTTVQVWVAG